MAQKPSIPKGTRDFSPVEVAKRNYIFGVIKSSFERFGFQPIETPSFENSDTLMGKYGDEGDRLIFKILNSGDFYRSLRMDDAVTLYGLEKFYTHLDDALNSDNGTFKDSIDYELKIGYKNEDYYKKIKDYILNINDVDFSKFLPLEDDYKNKYRSIILLRCARLFLLDSKTHISKISEKALRYDLTVPFARYVVQHQNEITFPFKRYQIQPVWRADRPQKGRFREFYQCDADVVGSASLLQEIEFIQLYDDVFAKLRLEGVTIKINNRKILSGIADVIGAKDKLIDFTVALDKLDKIGGEKVKEEMLAKGISKEGIDKLQPLFSLQGNFESQIESLKSILRTSEEGLKGIEELAFINSAIETVGLKTACLQLDVTLARGLNYYTGAIFEVSPPETVQMGSIGGGGRYDDLTGIFGLKDVSGVGISFGLDRIYLVLQELSLFPETIANSLEVLFINFGEIEAMYCLKAISKLREAGVNTEIYPDAAKMKKQMNYANKREIPFVVLVGEDEMNTDSYTLKNMKSGEQTKCSMSDLIKMI